VGDDKLDKLIDVLIKQILKKGIDFVTKEKIDMPKQGDLTAGAAFITLDNT